MSKILTTPANAEVGQKVRVDDARKTWTVQAVSKNFTVLVQQAPFEPKGTLQYTVLDWHNNDRGPCNLIGQGYGDGTYSPSECARMLAEFERGDLEVSHRNHVPFTRVEVTA
ncbi:hypothetical protein ACFWGN_17930 [Oerskovia sp. NPDC060338]|uniref:hypothetical protein n=1 Tax=Oerskovia sp. NPDC060338 TaxID=3347100 RepID=UPI003659E38C